MVRFFMYETNISNEYNISKTMDEYTKICCELAGGFSEVDSPCIVSVSSIEHSTSKITQVQSIEPTGQPADLLKRLSDVIDRPTTDIQIGVFQMCGGLDGSKL